MISKGVILKHIINRKMVCCMVPDLAFNVFLKMFLLEYMLWWGVLSWLKILWTYKLHAYWWPM